MKRLLFTLCFLLLAPVAFTQPLTPETLWDTNRLLAEPPETTVGSVIDREQCAIHEIWYVSEPFQGKSTRIFAYLGIPKTPMPPERFPGILLVHGGGGTAFDKWAEHWASRGYVALAMDLGGVGPDKKRHEQAGPAQDDNGKFRAFDPRKPEDVRDMWTYHAVAAILRGHALLAARPDVDAARIAETGISWGGYLSCIVAAVDKKLVAVVPVYGCGFLHESSAWQGRLAAMPAEQRDAWVNLFDPSRYLERIAVPVLFVNGTNDRFYPPDSYRKTCEVVRATNPNVKVALAVRRPHGHIWTFPEVDVFMDTYCRPGTMPPLPTLDTPTAVIDLQKRTVTVPFVSSVPISKAALCYTTEAGPWKDRTWQSLDAEIARGKVIATLPARSSETPLCFFVQMIDELGRSVTTWYLDDSP